MTSEKDKKLERIDSSIFSLEKDLDEVKKEYEDILNDDNATKVEVARLDYEKAQEDYKEKRKVYDEANDELKKLIELSTDRKHGSTSYGTRLGEITVLGNTIVVDR